MASLPFGASAVQNIFTSFGQITDIQFEGSNIDQVVFRGEVLWERPPKLAQTGDHIQTVTTSTCPTERTRVNDARDNATYWIQKMPDGKCWMLTNLAYGGGGTNTYGDVKSITSSNTIAFAPYYIIPTGSNKTTGTADPSTSTNGTGQYGYLYNWCAAMGAQAGTAACVDATTPAPNPAISICPSGWRLPTGGGGEFTSLANAIGATSDATGSTNLRNAWLAMYSGYWNGGYWNGGFWAGGFIEQGIYGLYWSSTQNPSYSYRAYYLSLGSGVVYPSFDGGDKQFGFAVRCIAN